MSAKSTPVGTSAPPIGASSKQTRHQLGFLRDGDVNSRGLNTTEPIPFEWRHAHATTGGGWPHTKEPAESKGGNIAVFQRFTPPPAFALFEAHFAAHLAAIIARRRETPFVILVAEAETNSETRAARDV